MPKKKVASSEDKKELKVCIKRLTEEEILAATLPRIPNKKYNLREVKRINYKIQLMNNKTSHLKLEYLIFVQFGALKNNIHISNTQI